MIPASCKRLIEVDFPIGVVSEHSAREKSIRHGHPSTLHLWWARRPLAACRSVLMGLLLPDPCDKDCPAEFKPQARDLLAKRYTFAKTCDDPELRELLLQFIGELANWDNSSNSLYLEIARGLVKAAHPEETPVVVDPFSGGGSIPLEALRLGCEAFASDLNPVACLILKTLLEDIPKYGNADFKLLRDLSLNVESSALSVERSPEKGSGKRSTSNAQLSTPNEEEFVTVHGLANALRHVGAQVKKAAEKELAEFYPADADGSRPIAYIWARTVRCEAVGCGAEIPLVRSFWLCKKTGRNRALQYTVERHKKGNPFLKFEIFSPKSESDIHSGTVHRSEATCPCCQTVLAAPRVRSQLTAQHGGADVQFNSSGQRVGGALLLAVVTSHPEAAHRNYRLPNVRDYAAVFSAHSKAGKIPKGGVPDEPLPWRHGHRALGAPRIYGMTSWGELFSSRQKLSLWTLGKNINQVSQQSLDTPALQSAVRAALAMTLSKQADYLTSMCTWHYHNREKVSHTFARQALPFVTDFVETVFSGNGSGSWDGLSEWTIMAIEGASNLNNAGAVRSADACKSPLPSETCQVWFTDPPYWDNVAYADLSDFFFVWLKRILPVHQILPDTTNCQNRLTPKEQELTVTTVVDERSAPKSGEFFYQGMGRAFGEGRRVLRHDGVGCVVFAHKTTEGWESLLTGMLGAGWVITASWPITTEMATRMVARDTAALAGSVHLVCRPRSADAGVGDWGEVKAAMEKRIREWLPTLAKHGVRGADAVFSCLGPALESYSRYDKVLTAADHEVPLGGDPEATEPHKRGFLAYVFEAVSKEALRQVLGDAETDGFEEDSRMTALFLWTLQGSSLKVKRSALSVERSTSNAQRSTSNEEEETDDDEKPKKAKAGFSMPFDTFIRITRPMGIHYPGLEGRVIEIEKGIVRLLPVRERSEQLLGEAATKPEIEISLKDIRQMELGLFIEQQIPTTALPTGRKKGGKKAATTVGGAEIPFTTLDRIHRAMLLFTLGRSVLLRQVLEEDMRQGKDFERLALALNSLYPESCDERRMLEGVQAAMRGIR